MESFSVDWVADGVRRSAVVFAHSFDDAVRILGVADFSPSLDDLGVSWESEEFVFPSSAERAEIAERAEWDSIDAEFLRIDWVFRAGVSRRDAQVESWGIFIEGGIFDSISNGKRFPDR